MVPRIPNINFLSSLILFFHFSWIWSKTEDHYYFNHFFLSLASYFSIRPLLCYSLPSIPLPNSTVYAWRRWSLISVTSLVSGFATYILLILGYDRFFLRIVRYSIRYLFFYFTIYEYFLFHACFEMICLYYISVVGVCLILYLNRNYCLVRYS